jgi:inositol transport system substrate-binding protein
MDKGELNMTVFQDPVGQGEGAVEGAYLAAKHQANPRAKADVIWVPYQKITKENYKSFMKK